MASNINHSSHPHWTIRNIPVEDEAFYLQRLKPFRLVALQQDPDAFGSSYAREIAFDDATWLTRLRNPLAKIFAAVQVDQTSQDTAQPEVLGTVTLYGPMPRNAGDDDFLAWSWAGGRLDAKGRDRVLVYSLVGVYTCSENRGLGIGKTLVEAAAIHAKSLAADTKCVVMRVEVFQANMAALALYSRCGFAVFEADGMKKEDGGRQTLIMYRVLS